MTLINGKNNIRIESIYQMFSRLDSITYNHSVRVMALAMEYEVYSDQADNVLSSAALIHDIGKIYIAPKILDKTGLLSDLERDIVNLHPYIGYEILKERGIREDICAIVLYHHGFDVAALRDTPALQELPDYGRIEMLSRVLRTLDAFEALTSDRPYHRGLSAERAVEVLSGDRARIHDNDGLAFLSRAVTKDRSNMSAVYRSSYMAEEGYSVDEILQSWETLNCI